MAKKKTKPDAAKRREELRKQLEESMRHLSRTPAAQRFQRGSRI